MRNLRASVYLALILCSTVGVWAQSLSYTSGQNVAPAYEGWEERPDGTRYFVFGYMNRNWEEELNIPVGPENGFNVGGADQGQPTRFLPRRNRFVFRVKVPANFTEKDEMVWTLTAHGETEKAYASLRLDYQIDNVVIASETGSLGAGSSSPETRANKAPVVVVEGSKTASVKVGEPLTLVAVVTDDGIPRRRGAGGGGAGGGRGGGAGRGGGNTVAPTSASPEAGRAGGAPAAAAASGGPSFGRGAGFTPPSRITVGKNNGLHLSWFVYRGEGDVTFDPPQIKVWEDTRAGANSPWAPSWTPPVLPADGRITVKTTFGEPGKYVLRVLADDGALLSSPNDVSVTVGH